MSDPATDDDVLGPIDIVIIEFSGGKLAGESANELLKLIDAVAGLRVAGEQETEGLDTALHNEKGYNL